MGNGSSLVKKVRNTGCAKGFSKLRTMDFLASIVLHGKCIRTSTFTCYVKVIYIFFLSFLKVVRESSATETRIRIINLIEPIELMVLVEPPLRCSISLLV